MQTGSSNARLYRVNHKGEDEEEYASILPGKKTDFQGIAGDICSFLGLPNSYNLLEPALHCSPSALVELGTAVSLSSGREYQWCPHP
mmetsp:Transcript_79879/g.175195  ORF Transcript_79879/g.175195 Transcript_79879/m.175195 type:complete len:87 (-) Transcript_79879:117-377(-)